MSRPVLLGGRTAPPARTFLGWLLRTWLPVVIMLMAIAIESTHSFSSDNTSGWMRNVYSAIAGQVPDDAWAHIHHRLRKTGHFTGYGVLGMTWMRAWLLYWLQPMRARSSSVWRRYAFAMAVFCTMLVASLDELHQSFMADRTGVVSDVLLDTAGAIAMLVVCWLIATVRPKPQDV